MLRVALVLLVVTLSVGGVLGYQALNPGIPVDPPDWHGKVKVVFPGKANGGWVLIRLDTEPPTDPDRPQYRECVAECTGETLIRRRSGKKGPPATFRVGQTVSVWCNGPFTSTRLMTRPAGFIVIEGE
jgi:hypothetical protein